MNMFKLLMKTLLLIGVEFTMIRAMSHQWEPQISILCETEHTYYPQFLSENGKWIIDTNIKATKLCSKDKMELLNYCKQVYPDRDITNIVESSHYQKIGGWCTISSVKKCKKTQTWIKSFRCLEGPFQSDALLVPEGCLFDHIHNTSRCWPFIKWNQTGAMACKEKNMVIRSFAMLLPCGISLFSGVEFVCCPRNIQEKQNISIDYETTKDSKIIQNISDLDVGVRSTVSPSLVVDPYFNSFDPKMEHQNFKNAQQRLEETHREKVTRVMKNWSDLEEKYQDMRLLNLNDAQQFKQEMTRRFQMSVQSLEEEENAAKHQLSAMHQQRVLERINQRKREAMKCYTRALTEQSPDVQTVEKCLQRLLRALHKDRTHALDHYRHILLTQKHNMEATIPEKALTLSRLTDIDKAMNQSMAMLKRFPELSKKLSQLMLDYVQALRSKDEIPGSGLSLTRENEEIILEKYRNDIMQSLVEKEKQHDSDKKKKMYRSEELQKLEESKKDQSKLKTTTPITNTVEDDKTSEPTTTPSIPSEKFEVTNVLPMKQLIEDVAAIIEKQSSHSKVQHSMKNQPLHLESHFKVKEEEEINSKGLLIFSISTLCVAFAFIVVKFRRSSSGVKSNEVGQERVAVSTEDKHLTQMQVNGYENPTYKYFEIKE